MVDTSCPGCARVNWVQRVPALHATGVSTVSGTDQYSGIGFSSTGLVPVMGAAVVNRTSTTALAQATMPAPSQVSIARPLLLGLLLSVPALLFLAGTVAAVAGEINAADSSVGSVVGVALVGLLFAIAPMTPAASAFAVAASRSRRNRRVQRGLSAAYAAWASGCYCHRCGVCFWPASPAPGVSGRHPFSPSEFRWVIWNIGGYGRYFNAA